MKKIVVLGICCMLTFSCSISNVFATSLDEAIQNQQEQNVESNDNNVNSNDTSTSQPSNSDLYEKNKNFIDGMNEAATSVTADTKGAQRVNAGLQKIASLVVQVMSYFITVGMAVRVVLDLAYIAIPFSRKWLAHGYQGNAQAGGGMQQPGMQNGMGGMGMGGMSSMGGMGMGGYGRGGMGMGGMGMGGMNGMGMGGMQNGMQAQQGQMQNIRIQFVSNAALNAVAAESTVGPDGLAVNPYKLYIKDMLVVLIITPILIILAATGVLTQLGLVLGQAIARGIQGIAGMV